MNPCEPRLPESSLPRLPHGKPPRANLDRLHHLLCRRADWLFPLCVLLLLVITSVPLGNLDLQARKELRETWRYGPINSLYATMLRVQWITMGAILGLPALLAQRGKPGRWAVRWARLLATLPAAIVAVLNFILRTPYVQSLPIFMWFIRTGWAVPRLSIFEALAGVLVGFSVVTSLHKRRPACLDAGA